MSDLRFTREHEWVRLDPDGAATVGITDYAQDQLGDIVYVELPETGLAFSAHDEVAVVESVKTVGEVYMPLSGTVQAINERLNDEPELVNQEPTGSGWLFRISVDQPAAAETLMDQAAYEQFVATL